MDTTISAKGYTNIILVLNMKRFIHPDSQEQFETIRGTKEFASVLKNSWPVKESCQDVFTSMEDYLLRQAGDTMQPDDMMLTEQVGYATGVFRSLAMEEYNFPTYYLDKDKVIFPDDLLSNFQFKTLFLRAWERWEIFIRPTNTGFFVIRLTQTYQDRPRSLLMLAQDVLHLQESLDIRSAQNWLKHNRERYVNQPETLAVKERSVLALLNWLGTDEHASGHILYYPVQWKLAMVIAGLFVEHICQEIAIPEQPLIRLANPAPRLSVPLHDSYVIHHIDDLLADPAIIKRAKSSQKGNVQILVNLNDIRNSTHLRKALVNLAEGSVLTRNCDEEPAEECGHFPTPRWSITDSILTESNHASWNDEFCLLSSRTAIIIPSRRWRDHELAVSTVPSATLRVQYARYWGAIERMIEFVMEIRVLVQLIESVSYDLLGEIVGTVQVTRTQIFEGDIIMDGNLPVLVTQAAHLRRLAALAQGLSRPQLWSRAEYAIQKAGYLMDQLQVPKTLEYIEHNISSINSVVDHIDEWYLADLSEKSNDRTTFLSIGLAAASLTLTLLVLPSFWADISPMSKNFQSLPWIWKAAGFVGTGLAIVLMALAAYFLSIAVRQRKYILSILKDLTKNSGDKEK